MSKIIVALDGMSRDTSLAMAKELSKLVWGFKVNDLLVHCGVSVVSELKAYGRVFADPKLYDIPNTVANGVARIADAGADLITVHASGGAKMIEAAVKASGNSNILAITVLTSFANDEVVAIYGKNTDDQVRVLSGVAAGAGAYGIVCSPEELSMLARFTEFASLAKVTPGVRPGWYDKSDDQNRIATPEKAVADGADLVVIGRPITGDSNPRNAAERINSEMA